MIIYSMVNKMDCNIYPVFPGLKQRGSISILFPRVKKSILFSRG